MNKPKDELEKIFTAAEENAAKSPDETELFEPVEAEWHKNREYDKPYSQLKKELEIEDE